MKSREAKPDLANHVITRLNLSYMSPAKPNQSIILFGTRAILLLFCALLPLPALAADEAHIKDLASRYDLVGLVTDTSVLKWNQNKEKSKSGRIYPIDPDKIPGGALYVGLGKDPASSDTPYFGKIYIKGKLYGYNELFFRVNEVKGERMRAMDDEGNEFLIKIIRRGSGYKRQ